ncbi:hypothetical protein ABK040_015726 [Willaertia magna]
MGTRIHPSQEPNFRTVENSSPGLERSKPISYYTQDDRSFVFSSRIHKNKTPSNSNRKVPSYLTCCLSIRTILISVIFLQAIIAALTVWAVSFSLGTKSSNEFVLRSMDFQHNKIEDEIKNYLFTAKGVTSLIKRLAENGEINMNTAPSMLFSIIKEFYSPTISIAFDKRENLLKNTVYMGYQYQLSSLMNTSYVWDLRYVVKDVTSNDLVHYDTSDGINFVERSRNKNYSVEARDWYQMSFSTNTSLWSPVYKTASYSPIATFYYGQVLYNKTTNLRIGFAKCNFNLKTSLNGIEYYTFLTENDGNIIGSNFNLDILTNRTNIFNNSDLGGVGEILTMYSRKMVIGQTVTLYDSTGKAFIISKYPFVFEELKWNIYLLFNEKDILQSVFSLTYASVGVIIGISILIIISGFFTGFLITHPLYVLMHEFTNIQALQLDEIKERSSLITEIDSIYTGLNQMVSQLKEWKSFLPEHLLKSVVEEEEFAVKSSVTHGTGGKHGGKSQQDIISRLQLGLEYVGCTMLMIRLSNFNIEHYSTPLDIMNIFSRVYSIISSVSNTGKGVLQTQDYKTFVICWAAQHGSGKFNALDSALKLKNSFDGMNHLLRNERIPSLCTCMSICSNTIYAGNIGSKTYRQFVTFGDLLEKCKRFINFKDSISVEESIIIDDRSRYADSKSKFVTKPVDRIMWKGTIATAFLLVGYAEIADNEWLYELEQKKKQTKLKEFKKTFRIFERVEVTYQELEEAFAFYSHQSDPISRRLLPVLRNALDLSEKVISLAHYHTKIESKITQYYGDRELSPKNIGDDIN